MKTSTIAILIGLAGVGIAAGIYFSRRAPMPGRIGTTPMPGPAPSGNAPTGNAKANIWTALAADATQVATAYFDKRSS